ncbi:MAG: glycosyltransferase [Chitinophagales bacterium]|nr:glycosyltransferase [Chitinophagales bacterium]
MFLSYDGMTDPLGQSQVLAYLEGLSDLGFRFTLISFEKKERFEKEKKEIQQRCKQRQIEWIPLIYTKHPPVISTLYDIVKMYVEAQACLKKENYSVVHCRSYITALVGERLKKNFGVKMIFDMRGFYADERVEGGLWNRNNPLYNAIYLFFKRKEKDFLSKADYVVSLTHAAKKIIHNRSDILNQPIPIQVIPCCADLEKFNHELFTQELKQNIRNELSIRETDFVLCYLGSIGTWYMLDEMLDFFKILKSEQPSAIFLFITNEPKDTILQKAKEKGIQTNDIRCVSSPHSKVPQYLSVADASIFFIKPTFSKTASSPTKQGELMGMNILQICNTKVGDVESIVKESGCGVVVQDFTEEQYRKAAKQLLQLKAQNSIDIRKYAYDFYSLKKGIENYADIYSKLLSQ